MERSFYRLLWAEIGLLLLSTIPWVFVFTLPIYTIIATQFFFLRKPLWLKAAASIGPIIVWITGIALYKEYKHSF